MEIPRTKDMDPNFRSQQYETISSAFYPLLTAYKFDWSSLHKLLLDDLGIRQIAVAIGGSMGGMLVLEWAYFGKDYVRAIVPIATSSRHSAWGISWGEAQRQSIYADPKYDDGYYPFSDPPSAGLGAARMSALLTYRSRNSFEARFGRNIPDASKKQTISELQHPSNIHLAIHNDGHRSSRPTLSRPGSSAATTTPQISGSSNTVEFTDPQFHGATALTPSSPKKQPRRISRHNHISATKERNSSNVSTETVILLLHES